MLSFLKITNLAILEELSLEPGPGLNVLTGETGAGKSIIVDAIGLLLGERGSLSLIRSGCEQLVVEAQFDLSARADAGEILSLSGLEIEAQAGELVIRRELSAGQEGALRGRAFVNGRMITLSVLKTLGEALSDLHGQHQHQSLLRAEGQRDALDRFALALDLRREVAGLHARVRALQKEREDLDVREQERAHREETLRRTIAEIETAAPHVGEEEDLAREETLLRHAEEIGRLAEEGFSLISDDDESAIARLGRAANCLRRLADLDPRAGEIISALGEARAAASEAASALAGYLDQEQHDPARLEQVAARLAEMQRLRRKYGASLREVLDYLERARGELASLGRAASRREEISAELAMAQERYMTAARSLSRRRREAARRLEKALERELEALAMDGTHLEISVEGSTDGTTAPHGLDTIQFLIAPNRGELLRPLSRIASGGELSRLMLALRNAAEAESDQRTLVFDEVDSGIGGRVAEVVGQRLAALGARQQVLCVTHLPQIASFADRHFQVSKRAAGARTRAFVALLDEEGKVEELARMLGDTPADTARSHAAALLGRTGRMASRKRALK